MDVSLIKGITYNQLAVYIYKDNESMGRAAARAAAACIQEAVNLRGTANILLATGNSQLSTLWNLRRYDLPWKAVNVFHIDEYLDLAPGHPAGFASFLRRHLLDHVGVGAFYPVPGHPVDVDVACKAYEMLLRAHPIDLCCLGIGENGHIAFNEPNAADFDDPIWVKRIQLEDTSRRQQVGEGHFDSLEQVPTHAITLTIPALRYAKKLLCIVPEKRKARAIRATLRDPISTNCPASILRQTSHARLYLDQEAAGLIV
jgi:glucosamine-6-phosphate deaminase